LNSYNKGFFLGNLLGAPVGGLVLDALTNNLDGRIVILYYPTQILGGGAIFAGSLIMLSTKLFLGNGKFLYKI
jgi:hypothetical protein